MARVNTRVEVFKRQPRQSGERGIWNPGIYDWLEVIEDDLYISRRRTFNKMAMFRLQKNMILELKSVEDAIRTYKGVLNDDTKRSEFLGESRGLESWEIDLYKSELRNNELIRHALKDIADGHLWRMLDYNRPLLYALGKHNDPGHIGFDDGFVNEILSLSDTITDRNTIAFVLNDITNYARIGDIISIRSDSSVEVKEVKSSNNKGPRWRKQRDKRDNFAKLANTGTGIIDDIEGSIVDVDIPMRTHLNILPSLFDSAYKKGIAYRHVSDYLKLVAVDFGTVASKKINHEARDTLFARLLKPWLEIGDSFDIIQSSSRHEFNPMLTPMSLYPLPENQIADLLLEKKVLYACYNFDALQRLVERSGWEVIHRVDRDGNSDSPSPFMIVQRGDTRITLHGGQLADLTHDLLDVRTFIRLLEENYSIPNYRGKAMMFRLIAERDIWY